ncbi:MAG: uracil-DNA glycosylase family protein [Desulfococcaceae bacterium]
MTDEMIGGPPPVPRRAYGRLLLAVQDSLRAMSASGCAGFDLSPEARAVLDRLAPPRRNSEEGPGERTTGPRDRNFPAGGLGTEKPQPRMDRPSGRPRTSREPARAKSPDARGPAPGAETLEDIRADLGDCRRCPLAEGRNRLVFGTGNPRARAMFVGEGPGRDEDRQGEPFVGRAGQLLNRIIQAVGMTRESVYIANVVKCRPPGNRNPEPDEMATCRPFLDRQIRSVRPEILVALGKVAARALLGTDAPLNRLRGRFHSYGETPLLVTYHPAFLLRYPEWKRAVWADMKRLMEFLHRDEK